MAKKRRRENSEAAAATPRPRIGRAATLVLVLAGVGGLAVVALRLHRPQRPNLLVVTIDTLRADRVGAYGYGAAETPVMDGLGRRGARFENVVTAVPITGPAHATLFTGQYPPVHGVRENVGFTLGTRHPTLATILQGHGYRTAAFVGAFPVAAAYGFGQGFDHYNEDFHPAPAGSQGAERPGNEVADRAIEWLKGAGDRPFFAWVHFYDPHHPYMPPPPYRARFAGRPYDGEVAFADAQLGRVLEAVEATGRGKDTVVAVLADHGESLGEHGEVTHAILIYQSTLRIPFFLAGPGVPVGVTIPPRVGMVDVLPTLLGLLGIESPPGLPGRDLRRALQGQRLPAEPLYVESLFGRLTCRWSSLRGWVSEDWKLVQGAETELFDLGADPGETRNLAAQEPQRVERMRAALQAAVRKMAPGGDSARSTVLSPEQEERLRSLGYVGGSGGAGSLDEPGLPDPRLQVHIYERVWRAMSAFGPAVPRALADMEAVVAVDPGNPFAHQALGHLAYRDGRLGTASRAFARSLELDPDRLGTRLPFGRLLREMDRLEDSERQLRIAVEQTTPDDDRTRIGLAETLTARGSTDEAGRIVEAVLARSPNDEEALAVKGRLLAAQGQPLEAVPYLERAGGGPEVEPWIELGELYLGLGQPDKAQQSAERALARVPGHPWALAVAGRALIREGRRAEGLEVLRSAVILRPRRPEGWLSLARAFEDAGRRPEAARCRRHAEEARRS
jgi:arylsulfatase A-like enzyme/tetratricopeptide (TPR) repeat protein